MQSELTAVNALLTSIGDTPVNSLDLVHSDVENARNIIETASLDLQSEGWWFNTEVWEYTLDVDGKQPLPTNTLYVNTDNPNWIRRGSYLYDLCTHSYSFASEELVGRTYSLVQNLPLSDLPYAAYSLIVTRAKLQFITELEPDTTKIQVLGNIQTNQYVQLQKLNLKFIEPNAMQSPQALKLLWGTPLYSTYRRRY